ncbi:MAG: AAA family ATPase, partial [Actinobacteria bacterium]|nr:AAA family ATPase [Actinomycetota bacterium]
DKIDFLTPEQRQEIAGHLSENRALAELTALICRHGITPGLAARIYKVHGADSIKVVKDNPYVLAEDVWGVGFIKADLVARATGVAPDSPYRVEAAVRHVLSEASTEGHCYLRPRDIMAKTIPILGKASGVGVAEVAAAVGRLVGREELVREGNSVYSARLWEAERELAVRVRALATTAPSSPRKGIPELVSRTAGALGVDYSPKQREAVETALGAPLSIITGGPGTGKTTITKALVMAYRELHPRRQIHLASPTGRAAKRLSQATGMEALTIHRLLEFHPEEGFRRDGLNPLEPGLLVVDEASMIDLELARSLFDAVPAGMQIVLVGDIDQLPSVGPGSVLRDSIASGMIPTVRLDYVYRQAEGSEIALWAHLIRDGLTPNLVSGEDVKVFEDAEQEDAAARVVRLAGKAHRKHGPTGYLVLAPMRRGVAGVIALNEAIREAVNPLPAGGRELRLGGTAWRLGDKVMVIRNNYALEAFNGDTGVIAELREAQGKAEPRLTVRFDDGREVGFGSKDAEILTLAYATTVHKAQGSEAPAVIVALTRGHWIMLQRNLLYTAVTRAKERLVVVYQPGAVERAVENDRIAERYSRLADRLREGSPVVAVPAAGPPVAEG